MALSFSSSVAVKAKDRKFERRVRWGHIQCLLTLGGLCIVVGTAWLGSRCEAIWSLWHESGYEVEQSRSTTWQDHLVNISIVTSAVDSGAVCLDGSPPAYFLDRGSGEGANNWVVFLEGGGWCSSNDSCLERSFTELGSSRQMPRRMRMGGVLSSSPIANPDFYNWNRVLFKYCDGGSFNGDVSEPEKIERDSYPGTKGMACNVFYRGQKIWMAVMENLLDNGMKKAQKAFLTGCSAGGLASILHCDQYRDLLPKTMTVKCLSDGGFFINVPDVTGVRNIEAFYTKVVLQQNMTGNLPKSCTSQRDATQCMFPEYLIMDISTPFFILNPAYDTWQFDNVLVPRAADPEGKWDNCRNVLSSCSKNQLKAVQGFRGDLLNRLQPILEREKDGAFIDSYYLHCQSQDLTWSGKDGPRVDNKSIAQVVGDWYFEKNSSNVIDCPFPGSAYTHEW